MQRHKTTAQPTALHSAAALKFHESDNVGCMVCVIIVLAQWVDLTMQTYQHMEEFLHPNYYPEKVAYWRVPRKRFEDVLRSTTCWPFFMAWPIQSDLQDQRYRAYRIKLLLKQTQVKVLCSAMVTLVEMKFKSTCTSPARLDFWPGFWTSSRPSSYREGMSREHIGDTWFMDSCLGYMQGVATTLIIGLTGLLDLVCIIISDLRLVSSSASEISAFDLTVPHTVFRMRHSVSIKQTIGALVFISTVQN